MKKFIVFSALCAIGIAVASLPAQAGRLDKPWVDIDRAAPLSGQPWTRIDSAAPVRKPNTDLETFAGE